MGDKEALPELPFKIIIRRPGCVDEVAPKLVDSTNAKVLAKLNNCTIVLHYHHKAVAYTSSGRCWVSHKYPGRFGFVDHDDND